MCEGKDREMSGCMRMVPQPQQLPLVWRFDIHQAEQSPRVAVGWGRQDGGTQMRTCSRLAFSSHFTFFFQVERTHPLILFLSIPVPTLQHSRLDWLLSLQLNGMLLDFLNTSPSKTESTLLLQSPDPLTSKLFLLSNLNSLCLSSSPFCLVPREDSRGHHSSCTYS